MVVDTSALVAIMRGEHEAAVFTKILDETVDVRMSAVAFVETSFVIIGRRADPDLGEIMKFVGALGIEVAAVSLEQAELAVDAFLRFGKGRHRAALNLADCFSYSLAKSLNVPLLYKGDDFARTDIAAAWRP